MSGIGKLAALAVTGALCAVILRKHTPELALCLSLAAGCVLLLTCAEGLSQVLAVLDELGEAGGLSAEAVRPVIKVAGISVVTRTASAVCRDAQESGLASLMETGGTVLALLCTLPLLTAVLSAVTGLL